MHLSFIITTNPATATATAITVILLPLLPHLLLLLPPLLLLLLLRCCGVLALGLPGRSTARPKPAADGTWHRGGGSRKRRGGGVPPADSLCLTLSDSTGGLEKGGEGVGGGSWASLRGGRLNRRSHFEGCGHGFIRWPRSIPQQGGRNSPPPLGSASPLCSPVNSEQIHRPLPDPSILPI